MSTALAIKNTAVFVIIMGGSWFFYETRGWRVALIYLFISIALYLSLRLFEIFVIDKQKVRTWKKR